MIQVCCAIIRNGDEMLAVQHGEGSSHPLQWEFPGGKIQADETAEACIIREIEEELMIRIDIVGELESVEFDYGTKQVRLIPFVCKVASGEIQLTEHIAQRWIGLEDWETIEWSGADRKLIQQNVEHLKVLLCGDRI